MTLEFSGLRVINVENLSGAAPGGGTDVRKVDLANALQAHLGSAPRPTSPASSETSDRP
jgi:cytochrome c biogenesis protein